MHSRKQQYLAIQQDKGKVGKLTRYQTMDLFQKLMATLTSFPMTIWPYRPQLGLQFQGLHKSSIIYSYILPLKFYIHLDFSNFK
jgi:hypothetical protein